MSDARDIAIIGAGQVVERCIAPGLYTAPGLWARWVFDPLARTSPVAGADIIRIPTYVDEACDTIDSWLEPGTPILIATPTELHLPYVRGLAGRPLIVEKPLTTSLADYQSLRQEGRPIFPLSYYLFEKALPLLCAARPECRRAPWTTWLAGEVGSLPADLSAVSGCILEGQGPAADVMGRPWVLEQGGHLWDTFFHLSCLLAAVVPEGEWTSLEVLTSHLHDAAEGTNTAVWVRGRLGGVTVSLAAVKGCAEHERWLRADGAQPFVADLEACAAGGAGLAWQGRYATQLRLARAWLEDPEAVSVPWDILDRAMQLNSDIAAVAEAEPPYRRGERLDAIFPGAGDLLV